MVQVSHVIEFYSRAASVEFTNAPSARYRMSYAGRDLARSDALCEIYNDDNDDDNGDHVRSRVSSVRTLLCLCVCASVCDFVCASESLHTNTNKRARKKNRFSAM